MNSYTFKHSVNPQDKGAIADFLFAVADELYLPDYASAQKVASLCFEKGGVFAAYHEGCLSGMIGYFLGNPACGFENKEVAFMYVAAILKPYRGTRLFSRGLLFALKAFRAAGIREIRLQAEETNAFTNGLYSRFARPLRKEHSLRGKPVITYGGSVADAIYYLETGKRPSTRPTPRAAHHHLGYENGHMAPLMINSASG